MKNNQTTQRINNLLPSVSVVLKQKLNPIIDERIEEQVPDLPTDIITYGGSVTAETMDSLLVSTNKNKVYNVSSQITITEDNKTKFIEEPAVGTTINAGANIIITEITTDETTTYKFDLYTATNSILRYTQNGTEIGTAIEIAYEKIVNWHALGNFHLSESEYNNCDITDFVLLQKQDDNNIKFQNRPEVFLPEGVSELAVEKIYIWVKI